VRSCHRKPAWCISPVRVSLDIDLSPQRYRLIRAQEGGSKTSRRPCPRRRRPLPATPGWRPMPLRMKVRICDRRRKRPDVSPHPRTHPTDRAQSLEEIASVHSATLAGGVGADVNRPPARRIAAKFPLTVAVHEWYKSEIFQMPLSCLWQLLHPEVPR